MPTKLIDSPNSYGPLWHDDTISRDKLRTKIVVVRESTESLQKRL